MTDQPMYLEPHDLVRLQALLAEYNNMLAHLDVVNDAPAFYENMAAIRSRSDEIIEAVSAPFNALKAYVLDQTSETMTRQEKDKVRTDFGTFYFTSPSPAVYIKGTEQFLAKLDSYPDIAELLAPNLTITSKTGSLVFRGKKS